jgi:hypothetical protein
MVRIDLPELFKIEISDYLLGHKIIQNRRSIAKGDPSKINKLNFHT